MKTKVCTKCKTRKNISEFNKNSAYKDNYCNWCKSCSNKCKKQLSIKYPWRRFLKLIKQRCNNPNQSGYKYYGGKGIECLITKDELKKLWFRDKAYLMDKPTIDRIDSDKNYTLKNCQFLEHIDNSIKRDKSNMIKPVLQFDLKGKFIREFDSLTIASTMTNTDGSCIAKCARGKRKTANGYKWEYKEDIYA